MPVISILNSMNWLVGGGLTTDRRRCVAFGLALGVALAVGASVRLYAFGASPLWVDEAWRASLTLAPNFLHTLFTDHHASVAITSPVYAYLNKLACSTTCTEVSIRLSSLIPSLATVVVVAVGIRCLTNSYLMGAAYAFLVAYNLPLIGFAKELKPYSLEVLVHATALGLSIGYFKAPSWKQLLSLFAALLIGIFSAANFVFLLVGAGPALLVFQLRQKRWRDLKLSLPLLGLLALLCVAAYVLVWRYASSNAELIVFWSQGFHENGSYLAFLVRKLVEMFRVAFLVPIDHFHPTPYRLLVVVLAVLTVYGLLVIARQKRWEILALVVLPIGSMICLNVLQMWPIGALRMNLFVYPYLMVASVLWWFGIGPSTKRWAGMLILFVAVASAAYARSDVLDRYQPTFEDSTHAIAYLRSRLGPVESCLQPKALVVLNPAIAHSVRFYTQYDTATKIWLEPLLSRCADVQILPEAYSHPEEAARQLANLLTGHNNVLFIYSHLAPPEVVALKNVAQHFGTVADEAEFTYAGGFQLIRR